MRGRVVGCVVVSNDDRGTNVRFLANTARHGLVDSHRAHTPLAAKHRGIDGDNHGVAKLCQEVAFYCVVLEAVPEAARGNVVRVGHKVNHASILALAQLLDVLSAVCNVVAVKDAAHEEGAVAKAKRRVEVKGTKYEGSGCC